MTIAPRLAAASDDGRRAERAALWLVLGVLIVRIIYLVWLSPYELLGDEAYYWEWSRHLELCYDEKGPGLAFLVAASVRLFGNSEWAVRLPTAVCSAAAAWVTGRLALAASGSRRAVFFSVALFLLLPAFQADAQLCTQDGPLILLWAVLAWVGLRLMRRWREAGEPALADWLGFAAILGLGFLFKQSFLLLGLSVPIYFLLDRPRLRLRPALLWHIAVAAVVFVVMISPMLIWNQQHGWPTLAHTEGHLGAGGDQKETSSHLNPLWTLSLIGSQLGAFGPAAVCLMAGACVWAWRTRRVDPANWPPRLWLICCAVPSLAFFLLLSFWKPVIGSWPFPSFVTLVALAGAMVAAAGGPRRVAPDEGSGGTGAPVRRGAGLKAAWEISVVYGILGWVILSFPALLLPVPKLGRAVRLSILPRFTGHRAAAAEVAALTRTIHTPDDRPPLLVTSYYMDAALMAFYLPDHPTVYCVDVPLGKRSTAYDFWPATDLRAPSLRGRTLLLIGSREDRWAKVLRLSRVQPLPGPRRFLGFDYAGLRHSDARSGSAAAPAPETGEQSD